MNEDYSGSSPNQSNNVSTNDKLTLNNLENFNQLEMEAHWGANSGFLSTDAKVADNDINIKTSFFTLIILALKSSL